LSHDSAAAVRLQLLQAPCHTLLSQPRASKATRSSTRSLRTQQLLSKQPKE
jgi:hypothetical protein